MWCDLWRSTPGPERGQATPAIVMAIGMVFAVGLFVSGIILDRFESQARVQNAADAAALAGVQGGESASRLVAEQNDTLLTSFSDRSGRVVVEVERNGERRNASATRVGE